MLNKVSKRHFVIVSVSVIAGVFGIAWMQMQLTADSSTKVASSPVSMDPVQSVPQPIPQILPLVLSNLRDSGPSNLEFLVSEIVQKLVTDHAHEKHDVAFQVTLKEIRDDLMIDYPEQGATLFERIVRTAFPELADQILALIAKKDIYDTWLLNNMLDLNEMDLSDQKEALWVKRYEIFGKEDAERIWEPERSEQEERAETMHTVIDMLNQSKDMAMHDRVYILKSAYDENFFGTVEDLVLDASGVLAQTIFSMDVVQDELRAMTPEQRQEEINAVRRQLGFEESQIEWLAQRDVQREQRWQNGYAYMAERAQIESQFSGEALEQNLDLVRDKYFKEEASTIKKEEEMLEFFRYKRERVYGRN